MGIPFVAGSLLQVPLIRAVRRPLPGIPHQGVGGLLARAERVPRLSARALDITAYLIDLSLAQIGVDRPGRVVFEASTTNNQQPTTFKTTRSHRGSVFTYKVGRDNGKGHFYVLEFTSFLPRIPTLTVQVPSNQEAWRLQSRTLST